MKEIASLNNAVVKAVSELKQKKYRERENCFVVEGLRAVEEAVSYAKVRKIFAVADKNNARLQKLLADAEAKVIELYSVTEAVMKKMSDTEAPQGVLAVCEKPHGVNISGGDVLVLDRCRYGWRYFAGGLCRCLCAENCALHYGFTFARAGAGRCAGS